MKYAEDNEMNFLLHQMGKHSRAGDAGNGRASDHAAEQHLDADELNSFAEGVLPPSTRAAYAAHLADCKRCRQIVVELASASGVGISDANLSKTKEAGFWTSVSRLFRPDVLRFAVPALAILFLVAVAFIWTRQKQSETFVAQNQPAVTLAPAPSQPDQKQPAAAPEVAKKDQAASKSDETKKTTASEQGSRDQQKSERERGQAVAAQTPAASPAAVAKDAEPAGTRAAPSAARSAQDAGAAAPKPQKEVGEKANENFAKEPDQPAAADTAARNEPEKRRDKDESADKKAKAGSVTGQVSSLSRLRAARGEQITRVVAGRSFRREDNVWVDTAYDHSSPVKNVTRGSEQYRKLIGEQPSLREIAEQLEGPVIVVLKGKAYRIRS